MTVGLQPAAEQALRDAGQPVPDAIDVQTLVDTGSTFSVIATGTGARLGLQPVGVVQVSSASHADVPCEQFAVRLVLPDNVVVDITATEMPMPGQGIQALIGRDLMSRGSLIYIGYAETFSLNF